MAKRKRRCLVGTWSPRNTQWSTCQSCCAPVQRLKRWTSRGRLLRTRTGAHASRFVLWGLQCGVLQCATRGATRYLIAPPYRAIRCAIRYLVALGTLHHLIAFHLILLCPVAPVAFFIRCCTHAPIFTHLLLSSQVTVVQWPRLDLVQAPEAPDVAGSKVGHVAPAAEAFTGVGEEWFLPGPPAVF